jgi:type IV secretion system protein TrbF
MRPLHPFKRGSSSFGTMPEPITPYQRAAQVWDDRIGSARVQARNWRLMAFVCLGVLIAQGIGLYWLSRQARITPYVVEVTSNGEVRAVGAALANWHPSDAQIAHELARFIQQTRSLASDPIVVRQNWLLAYDLVTTKAAASLNEYAASNDPFKNLGKRTVTVDISSVVRAGPDSFELRWRESSYEQGRWMSEANYTAILGIKLQTPTTEDVIRKNPLGLYIDTLNWSKDLMAANSENKQAAITPSATPTAVPTSSEGDRP